MDIVATINEVKLRRDWSFTWKSADEIAKLGADVVVPLIEALKDQDGFVRTAAAQALGIIGDKRSVNPLINAMRYQDNLEHEDDEDCEARCIAATALEKIGDPQAYEPLIETLHDTLINDWTLSWYVMDALGALADPRAVPHLLNALSDARDIDVCKSARSALIAIGKPAIPAIVAAFLDKNKPHRNFLAQSLKGIADLETFEVLAACLNDQTDDAYVRGICAEAIGKLKDARSFAWLLNIFIDDNEDEYIRRSAARGLALLGDARAYSALSNALAGSKRGLNWDIIQALGNIGDDRAIQLLIPLFQDQDWQVCKNAIEALGKLADERLIPLLTGFIKDIDSLSEAEIEQQWWKKHLKTTAINALQSIQQRSTQSSD